MGICFSEPPVEPHGRVLQTNTNTTIRCRQCGAWLSKTNLDICEICLQNNAMKIVRPPPQYTYPVSYPQQQMYYQQYPQQQQQQQYYYPPQQQYPQQPQQQQYYYPPQSQQQQQQQQRQMGPVGAIATGFVVGAVMGDILDPIE